jgi:hypothetical protein
MGASIRCFFLRPIADARQSLRRFTFGDKAMCPAKGTWGHDATVVLGAVPFTLDNDLNGSGLDNFPHEDPRWPALCSKCGYEFQPGDRWQHNLNRLFSTDAFPIYYTLESAPPGAMYYADWYPWKGPDGHCLVVKTPAGEWIVDRAPYSGGGAWTRTGAPPNVTANPSILFPGPDGFHGWLRDGVLVEC